MNILFMCARQGRKEFRGGTVIVRVLFLVDSEIVRSPYRAVAT